MGASASSVVSKVNNEIVEGAYNTCSVGGSTNIATFNNVQYHYPEWCDGAGTGFDFGQKANVDSTCVLTAMQKSASAVAATLSAEARTGLGLSAASDVSSITSSMNETIANNCSSEPADNNVTFNNVDVTACSFRVVQDASSRSVCETNATQDLASNIAVKAAAQSTGFLGGLFSGGLTTIIVVIVILIVLIGGGGAIFYFVKGQGGEKTPTPPTPPPLPPRTYSGGAFGQSQSGTIIIIVLFILIVMLLLSPSMANKPPLSNDDLTTWSNMAKETQSMAGLSESSTTENDVFYDQYQNTYDVYSDRQDMLEANASLDKFFNKLY